jgi:uncharacterized protein (TIGR00369 family)
MPPAAATLGLEVLDADPEHGTIELAFTATEAFTNPAGNVLAGFLAAMLYDTVGPALLATLAPGQFQSTMELNARFLRPVRPGRLLGSATARHPARRERALTSEIAGNSRYHPRLPIGPFRVDARVAFWGYVLRWRISGRYSDGGPRI